MALLDVVMLNFFLLFRQDGIFISSDIPALHQSHLLLHFISLHLHLVANTDLTLMVICLKECKGFFFLDLPVNKMNRLNSGVPLQQAIKNLVLL
jgi:hypothetical protein